jgi:hypothetical protein
MFFVFVLIQIVFITDEYLDTEGLTAMKHCFTKYRQIRNISLYFIIALLLLMMGCQSSNPSETIAEKSSDLIHILTQSLDSGTTGQAYNGTLTAQGGDQTYTWNVIAGVLPQGITLDSIGGVLAGTPLVAGEYTFTVQMSDISSLTDSKEFTLSIQANGEDDDPETSDCGCEPLNNVVEQAINVSSVAQLEAAVSTVNSSGGNRTILIADGTYTLNALLHITSDNVMIRSASGNRNNVVLLGKGMSGNVGHIFLVAASHVTIADITMGEVYYHAIQVQGEQGANDLLVHNTRIFNTHEQMIKGSYSPATNQGSDNGIVRCSLLEYTANFGPQYYIGGIDIHRGANWTVQNNTFKNIRSPKNGTIAEHAIHFWSNSANPLIEKNIIINCDRGIGLGLGSSGCSGGTIRNNTIYGNNSGLNSDVGIALETATNVHVSHNSIFFDYNYPNAIEYRFAASTGNIIINNLTNKAISSRNSGQATVRNNVTNAVSAWFINSTQGDLHLASSVAALIGMGETIATVTEDMDCDPRPDGEFDIGADQL